MRFLPRLAPRGRADVPTFGATLPRLALVTSGCQIVPKADGLAARRCLDVAAVRELREEIGSLGPPFTFLLALTTAMELRCRALASFALDGSAVPSA